MQPPHSKTEGAGVRHTRSPWGIRDGGLAYCHLFSTRWSRRDPSSDRYRAGVPRHRVGFGGDTSTSGDAVRAQGKDILNEGDRNQHSAPYL